MQRQGFGAEAEKFDVMAKVVPGVRVEYPHERRIIALEGGHIAGLAHRFSHRLPRFIGICDHDADMMQGQRSSIQVQPVVIEFDDPFERQDDLDLLVPDVGERNMDPERRGRPNSSTVRLDSRSWKVSTPIVSRIRRLAASMSRVT